MRMLRRYALPFLIIAAMPLFAVNEGRVQGTVVDAAGNPIADAKIVLSREGTAMRQEKTTSAQGRFSLLILDATVKYHIHIEKESYLPLEETLTPVPGDSLRVSYTLQRGS